MRGCLLAVCIVSVMLFPCTSFAKQIYQKAENCDCKVYNPYPQPSEKVFWYGECKDGFAHGVGKLRWESLKKGKKYWSEMKTTLSRVYPAQSNQPYNAIVIRIFSFKDSLGSNYTCSGPKDPLSQYPSDIYICNGRHVFDNGDSFDGEFETKIYCSIYGNSFGGHDFHRKLEGKLVTTDKKVVAVSKSKEKRDREDAKLKPSDVSVKSSKIIGSKKTSSKGWTYDVRCVYSNGNMALAGVDEYEGRYTWHNPACQKNSVIPTVSVGTLQQAVHNACNCMPNN